jgi:Ala-tRNA(Pro) deacylase
MAGGDVSGKANGNRNGMIPSRTASPLSGFLDRHDIPFRMAEEEERTLAIAKRPANACRAVLLRTDRGWRMAVIPAERRLDIAKAREALAEDRLRLATESETVNLFPEFEAGSLPPIGPHYSHPELFDLRLLDHDEVMLASGRSAERVLVDPRSIVSVGQPTVADVCED